MSEIVPTLLQGRNPSSSQSERLSYQVRFLHDGDSPTSVVKDESPLVVRIRHGRTSEVQSFNDNIQRRARPDADCRTDPMTNLGLGRSGKKSSRTGQSTHISRLSESKRSAPSPSRLSVVRRLETGQAVSHAVAGSESQGLADPASKTRCCQPDVMPRGFTVKETNYYTDIASDSRYT